MIFILKITKVTFFMFLLISISMCEEDIQDYKIYDFKAVDSPKIINSTFESGENGWNIPNGYKIVAEGGRNNSKGLFYERTNENTYSFASVKVNLVPGIRYKYSVWVKTEDITGYKKGASVCLQFYKNGKWIGGNYPHGVVGTRGWTKVEGEAVCPDDATYGELALYIRKGKTGKAWFDEVQIEPVSPVGDLSIAYPAFERITPQNGYVKLNVYHECKEIQKNLSQFKLHIKVNAKSCEKTMVVPIKNYCAEIDIPNFPIGDIKLIATLIKRNDKIRVFSRELKLKVVSDIIKRPKGSCHIDKQKRAVIDDKLYLPVGLYMFDLSKEDLDRVSSSPFNCIMPYQSTKLNLNKNADVSIGTIKEALDYCNKKDLKVIFSIKHLYKERENQTFSWLGVNGEDNIFNSIINAFKEHPAMLAWYINDERPLSMIDKLIERRKIANTIDPFHPTWAVINRFYYIPHYNRSCDILGVDPYPIWNKGSADMLRVDFAMDYLSFSNQPSWVVPQIFNYGMYMANGNSEEFKTKFSDPTEEQIRSITLLMALRGAKGFMFYSYFDLKRPLDKSRFNETPPQTQKDFDKRWGEVCRVGKMLRELEPFILSDKNSKAVNVEIQKGDVQAREFTDNNGNVRIMIAAIGPGEAEAIITSNTGKLLKSVYGKCEVIGDNKYRFTGKDICSDILRSEK
jgi:hypothetical protein